MITRGSRMGRSCSEYTILQLCKMNTFQDLMEARASNFSYYPNKYMARGHLTK